MWIIFAGVSILMAMIFIFDDIYCSKVHDNQQKSLYVAVHEDNNDKNLRIIRSSNFEKEKY